MAGGAGAFGAGRESLPEGWRIPELRVDRDGDWFDGEVQITHPGIVANLRASLRRDAAGYFIQTRVRIPVRVEDTPFVVTRLERRGDVLHVILNDGTEESVDPASLRFGPDDAPYVGVKAGGFEARCSQAATFQLLALADYDEGTGQGVLRLAGAEYPLRRAS